MSSLLVVRERDTLKPFAAVVSSPSGSTALGANQHGKAWADWVNAQSVPVSEISKMLDFTLTAEIKPFNNSEIEKLASGFSREDLGQFRSLLLNKKSLIIVNQPQIQFIETHKPITFNLIKSSNLVPDENAFSDDDPDESEDVDQWPITDIAIAAIDVQYKNVTIDYKAAAFHLDRKVGKLLLEVKGARAIWDPDVADGRGSWRCPPETTAAGQFTNRLGAGCSWGLIRRIGRGLSAAGQGIPKLEKLGAGLGAAGEANQKRKLEKQKNRLVRRIDRTPAPPAPPLKGPTTTTPTTTSAVVPKTPRVPVKRRVASRMMRPLKEMTEAAETAERIGSFYSRSRRRRKLQEAGVLPGPTVGSDVLRSFGVDDQFSGGNDVVDARLAGLTGTSRRKFRRVKKLLVDKQKMREEVKKHLSYPLDIIAMDLAVPLRKYDGNIDGPVVIMNKENYRPIMAFVDGGIDLFDEDGKHTITIRNKPGVSMFETRDKPDDGNWGDVITPYGLFGIMFQPGPNGEFSRAWFANSPIAPANMPDNQTPDLNAPSDVNPRRVNSMLWPFGKPRRLNIGGSVDDSLGSLQNVEDRAGDMAQMIVNARSTLDVSEKRVTTNSDIKKLIDNKVKEAEIQRLSGIEQVAILNGKSPTHSNTYSKIVVVGDPANGIQAEETWARAIPGSGATDLILLRVTTGQTLKIWGSALNGLSQPLFSTIEYFDRNGKVIGSRNKIGVWELDPIRKLRGTTPIDSPLADRDGSAGGIFTRRSRGINTADSPRKIRRNIAGGGKRVRAESRRERFAKYLARRASRIEGQPIDPDDMPEFLPAGTTQRPPRVIPSPTRTPTSNPQVPPGPSPTPGLGVPDNRPDLSLFRRARARRIQLSNTGKTGKFYSQSGQTAGPFAPAYLTMTQPEQDALNAAALEALEDLDSRWRRRLGVAPTDLAPLDEDVMLA